MTKKNEVLPDVALHMAVKTTSGRCKVIVLQGTKSKVAWDMICSADDANSTTESCREAQLQGSGDVTVVAVTIN